MAIVDDTIAGLVSYYDIYSSFVGKSGMWLDDLYVYEAWRRRGVGRALLAELCKEAQRSNCARIDWIVARDNDRARGFYEGVGAKIFEQVRHTRLDEDAIRALAVSLPVIRALQAT